MSWNLFIYRISSVRASCFSVTEELNILLLQIILSFFILHSVPPSQAVFEYIYVCRLCKGMQVRAKNAHLTDAPGIGKKNTKESETAAVGLSTRCDLCDPITSLSLIPLTWKTGKSHLFKKDCYEKWVSNEMCLIYSRNSMNGRHHYFSNCIKWKLDMT